MSQQNLESFCSVNPESLGLSTPAAFEFRYLDISAVTEGRIDWSATRVLKFSEAPSRARRQLRVGDVLLCTVRPGLKAHARIQEADSYPLVSSTGFAVLRPHLKTDSSFLFHSVFSDLVAVQLRARETGSNYPAVNERDVKQLRLHSPEPEERYSISVLLDLADNAIAKTHAVVAKLKQVRAGLLHDLLTRGLDENGQLRDANTHPEQFKRSKLGSIPRAWVVVLLDDVAARGSGHTPDKENPSYWYGGVKWVSLADSHRLDRIFISETDKEISDLGISNSSAVKHPSGTVLISRDAGIGKSAIMTETMAVSQHFITWTCGRKLSNLFLYYWLQHSKRRFESIAMGSTIKTIGLPFFKTLEMALPSRSEQDAASKILFELDQLVFSTEIELEKQQMLRCGLMADLLTGRVRVPESILTPETHG